MPEVNVRKGSRCTIAPSCSRDSAVVTIGGTVRASASGRSIGAASSRKQLCTGWKSDLGLREAQHARRTSRGEDGRDRVSEGKSADDAGGPVAQRRCGADALDAALLVDALARVFYVRDLYLYRDRTVIGEDEMVKTQLDLRGFVSNSQPNPAN